MSAEIITFRPHGGSDRQPVPAPTADETEAADIVSTAEALRGRYVALFDQMVSIAVQYAAAGVDEPNGRRPLDLTRAMNGVQSEAAEILERIRIEAKLARFERDDLFVRDSTLVKLRRRRANSEHVLAIRKRSRDEREFEEGA
jgi:hypothetical protein